MVWSEGSGLRFSGGDGAVVRVRCAVWLERVGCEGVVTGWCNVGRCSGGWGVETGAVSWYVEAVCSQVVRAQVHAWILNRSKLGLRLLKVVTSTRGDAGDCVFGWWEVLEVCAAAAVVGRLERRRCA